MVLLPVRNSFAQSCNQVEILYKDLDCSEKDSHPDGAQGGKGCKAVSACKDQSYPYSALGSWSTYNWTVTGPASIFINPNNTVQNINIIWPQMGTYTLTLTVTDGSGNTFTTCLTVTVKDKPLANFTFSPNNVCEGSTISFTNGSTFTGGMVYSWNFSDPTSGSNNYSSLANPTHTFNAAGNYAVTLIVSSFTTVFVPGGANGHENMVIKTCCSDTITKMVTIVQGIINIECISTVCAGDTATYTAVGCANPVWLTPTGGTILSQSGNQVTIVWGNGTLQGVIKAQCPGGCIASVPVPIIPTNPMPTGIMNPCSTSTTSYTMPVLPGTFYTWHLNNLTPTNYDYLLTTYPDNNTVWINWNQLPPGTYQLTIDLANKHLCCNSTGVVTIISKGTFTAYYDQTVCTGNPASLSVFPAAGTFNWTISPSAGVVPSTGSGNSFSPVFNVPGNYVVTVNETGNTYCNTTQQVKIKVILTPVPGTISGPSAICPGSQYTYSMSTAAPSGFYYSWQITMGGGTFQPGNLVTTTGNSTTIAWTSLPANISVTLLPISPPPCPTPAVTLSITQAAIGTLSGSATVCVDDSLVYTLSGGNLPSTEDVQWAISPASMGTVIAGQGTNSPKILWHGQVSGIGPWTATITASSNCGSTALTVTISKKPVFTLSQTGNICLPGGVVLTATGSGPYTYTWSNSATGPTTSVSAAGFYTATATNGSCSFSRTIEVKDPFFIRPITCNVGYCNGINTNEQLGVEVWKPGSGTFTYEWYSGTYSSGTLLTTVTNTSLTNFYTALAPGNYYVIVKYGSCQKFASFTVNKVCCPDVNLPVITNVTQLSCNDYSFTGTASNPGGAPITWNFGDGTTQAGTSGVPVTHHYVHAFDYCVTFCVGSPVPNPTNCTGNCATARAIVPIEALFTYTIGCNGCVNITDYSIVLASPSQISYLWNFGDGFTSTSVVPPAHCYAIAGNYTITLTITYNNGIIAPCSSSYPLNVTYTPLSIAMASPVCTGQLTNMSSSPAGFLTYAWNFGDSLSSYIPSTSHAYSTVGSKLVTLTVTDLLGNTCIASNNVNVLQGISNCTILPGYICPGGSATLTAATGAGFTYVWQQYTGSSYVAPVPNSVTNTLSVTTPGFYRVIITNANGCSCISNLVEVKTATKPKALIAASPSTMLCGPGSVMLTSVNEVPGFTSEWYANGNYGSLLYTGNMYYDPAVSTTTNYSLVLTNQYGCKDTCSMTIYVNPIPAQPVIVSNPSGTLCEGIPIQLTVTNYTGNITWSTGASTLTITVSSAGIYTATYTDPVTGCTSKKNILVNRRPPVDLFPHSCDSIPCECIRPFTIYAPLPLSGPLASAYTIQWYNPALAGSGPVLNNVTTGSYYIVVTDPATGCSSTSNSYSVVVPSCDTCGCDGSSWEFINLTPKSVDKVQVAKTTSSNNPNPQVIKLECNGAYELKCNQPYTVNAGFNCGDTNCTPKVTWQLTLPDNTTQSGNAPFTFVPTQSGAYTLMLYGWCGNSVCDSCVITFKVNCEQAGCDCKNSHWGEISLSIGQSKKIIKCNTPLKLKCNVPFTINGTYFCTGPACPGTVSYTLTPPAGPVITGSLPLTYTPLISGVYVLELTGMCGNVVCDKCIFDITVECPPVEQDCCPHEKDLIIKGVSSTITQQSLGGNNYSLYSANITIAGGLSPYQQVKATVLDFQLISNYEECIACKNKPFTWSSLSAGNLAGITPTTTGATPAIGFNVPANPTENPREIVWENGSPINLSTPQPTTINLYLPAASALLCCELSAKVCIKFSFIDTNCKLCEKIVCGTVKISKGQAVSDNKETDKQAKGKKEAGDEEFFK
jgi:PKD repeat protein